MDGVINIQVNGYSIVKDHNCAGAQFESGSTKLRIAFGEDWDQFAKKVTFWDALGQNPTKVNLGNDNEVGSGIHSITIPGEVLNHAGRITVTIDGYLDGVRKRTVEFYLNVLKSRKADDAEEPTEPTPTPHEQLQAEIIATEEKLKEFYQGGETDTVETEVGYVTTEVYDVKGGQRVQVSVEENDVKHVVSSTNLESHVVIEAYDYEKKRTYTLSFRGSITVSQTILSTGKKYGYDIRSEEKSTITIAKTSERKSILSKVKEKSIGMKHLADEVGEQFDTIPTKVSQLENDSGFLKDSNEFTVANSKTIEMLVKNGSTSLETYNISENSTIRIDVADGDIAYVFTFAQPPVQACAISLYENGMGYAHSTATTVPVMVVLSDYDFIVDHIIISTTPENTVTVERWINQEEPGLIMRAEVKLGSIGYGQLSSPVNRKLERIAMLGDDLDRLAMDTTMLGEDLDRLAMDTTLLGDDIERLKQKEIPYASKSTAGIVQISSFGGLNYGNAFGGLFIDGATEDEIQAKSHIYKPVATEYFDYAIAQGTHQEMKDDYDATAFKTCWSMEGKQGQLPVSYDAVKKYVGGITGDIDVQLQMHEVQLSTIESNIGDIDSALDNIIALQGQY